MRKPRWLPSRARAGMAAGLAALAAALVGRGRLRRYAVAGASMQPSLRAGDWVVVDRGARAAVGDVVVATRPDRPEIEVIKRVARRDDRGRAFLVGDNPASSTDSRQWGPVGADEIHGVVRFRYWPLGRLGRIDRGPSGSGAESN